MFVFRREGGYRALTYRDGCAPRGFRFPSQCDPDSLSPKSKKAMDAKFFEFLPVWLPNVPKSVAIMRRRPSSQQHQLLASKHIELVELVELACKSLLFYPPTPAPRGRRVYFV